MNCNWPKVRLGDVCKIRRGSSPRPIVQFMAESGMPWVKIADATETHSRFIEKTNEFIKLEGVPKSVIVNEGDLILSNSGTAGLPKFMKITACIHDGWQTLSDFDGIDKYFLYYSLLNIRSNLLRNAHDSTMKNLTLDMVRDAEIHLPTLSEQKSIATVLSDIDSKFELNVAVNQNLEQMAQAIFKSWFVDFDPVKAKMNGEQPQGMDEATASLFPEKLDSETEIPEGWTLSEIGDEVTVVGGGTPSTKNDEFWQDGHIHWTSPKDLSGLQDKVLLDTASKITEAGLKKISSGLLPVDTVLLSSRAPVGYLALAKVPVAINQGYIAMKCEKLLPPEFVIQWCVHRMDEIKQRASGSTFAEISKKSFKPISVVVPDKDVLYSYKKLIKPIYDAITSNARQNEQLSCLRDTLLPKLLSGEISLSE